MKVYAEPTRCSSQPKNSIHARSSIFVVRSWTCFWKRIYIPIKLNHKVFFFCLDFLSRPFTNHITAGEGGRHFFNSSPPLPPVHRHLDISWAITAESSPLHFCSPLFIFVGLLFRYCLFSNFNIYSAALESLFKGNLFKGYL